MCEFLAGSEEVGDPLVGAEVDPLDVRPVSTEGFGVVGVLLENAFSNGGTQKNKPTNSNNPSTAVLAALAFRSRTSCCEIDERFMVQFQ